MVVKTNKNCQSTDCGRRLRMVQFKRLEKTLCKLSKSTLLCVHISKIGPSFPWKSKTMKTPILYLSTIQPPSLALWISMHYL